MVHSLDINLSDTLQVGDKWGLSSSIDMLRIIAKGRGPKKWILALGYSGWGAGQLNAELSQKTWFITDGEINNFFLEIHQKIVVFMII